MNCHTRAGTLAGTPQSKGMKLPTISPPGLFPVGLHLFAGVP
jgi:hypothetical protein